MSTRKGKPPTAWPPVGKDALDELQPVLTLVRAMRRFLDEVIDKDPELRQHYARLNGAYTTLLQDHLAPHAFNMAELLIELEDAYTAGQGGIAPVSKTRHLPDETRETDER